MPPRVAIRWLRASRSREVRTRGLIGTAFASTAEHYRTVRRNAGSWTSSSTQPGSRRGNGGRARAIGPCRSIRREITVRDATRAIDVSSVGTEDWVAKNRPPPRAR
jgi:hypothetical protein